MNGIHSCVYTEAGGPREALRVTDVALRREQDPPKEVRLSTTAQVDKYGVLRDCLGSEHACFMPCLSQKNDLPQEGANG